MAGQPQGVSIIAFQEGRPCFGVELKCLRGPLLLVLALSARLPLRLSLLKSRRGRLHYAPVSLYSRRCVRIVIVARVRIRIAVGIGVSPVPSQPHPPYHGP